MLFHKLFDHSFIYKNKNLIASICCKYNYEHDISKIDLESEEEDKEYLKCFETGEYLNLTICVTASWLDEYGEDYLSEVHILAKDADHQIDETITHHNMVENAIYDLKSAIDEKIKLLEDNLELKFT